MGREIATYVQSQSLAALQNWLQAALMFPATVQKTAASEFINPSHTLLPDKRLAIYQRGYSLRLLKCMEEQFPALKYALGEALFFDFCREYLRVYPSSSYTLYDLGKNFPKFLDETQPESHEEWAEFMVDLAWCERHLFQMFDAPGYEGKALAGEDVPDDRLYLQPCVAICHYRFPVSWFYHEVKKQNSPAIPFKEDSYVVLVRKDYVTSTYQITRGEFQLLEILKSNVSVNEALGLFSLQNKMEPADVKKLWYRSDSLRRHWINSGFFVAKEKETEC